VDNKSGIKDLYRAGMKKSFTGIKKSFTGMKNWGKGISLNGMKENRDLVTYLTSK
jgi:hypothetical protein